jgi:hypothetical protein
MAVCMCVDPFIQSRFASSQTYAHHYSGLEGLEGIAALPLLRELHASHNRIRDVGPLCLHEHLEVSSRDHWAILRCV